MNQQQLAKDTSSAAWAKRPPNDIYKPAMFVTVQTWRTPKGNLIITTLEAPDCHYARLWGYHQNQPGETASYIEQGGKYQPDLINKLIEAL